MVQYPALCVSLMLLVLCVSACSSWLGSGFRVSCRFSADTSAILMAPTASERREEKPTSMPAFLHGSHWSPLNNQPSLCVCVLSKRIESTHTSCTTDCISSNWRVKRSCGNYFPSGCVPWLYLQLSSWLVLVHNCQSWGEWRDGSGSTGFVPVIHFSLPLLTGKKSHKMRRQLR